MKKQYFNEIGNSVKYSSEEFKFEVINFDGLEYYQQKLLKPFIQGKMLDLPTISSIVLANYPFVNKMSSEILQQLIERGKRINLLVDNAVKTKKGPQLEFSRLDEKDKFIINLAKSIIFDLNKLLYKYEIKKLWSNLVMVNNDFNSLYLGTLDLVGSNGQEWFLFTYKTSSTSYLQKYSAELFLQKELFETNTNFKIKKMFILNPRAERVVLEARPLSNGEIWNLKKLMKKNEMF